jgi:two-component system, sensor histidine kinase PdtaS
MDSKPYFDALVAKAVVDRPSGGDPPRQGSSISSPDLRSSPRRGCGMEGRCRCSATFSADLRSPPGRAFQTAEPVTVKIFSEQEEYVRSDFLKEHGIVAVANVPVLIDGAAWGVLEVDSTTPREFTEDTTYFLTAAAALIGIVLRHIARPNEEARLMVAAAEAQKREILLREMQHRVKNNF